MKNFLTAQEVIILQEAHHSARLRKSADRIKTILFLNNGFSYHETAKLLMLDKGTIRRYEKEYQKTGVDGLLEDHYHGSSGFLSIREERELTAHLKIHTYQTVKEVVSYVNKIYHKSYSIAGMNHLLHRLNFTYKKTKQIPGRVDPQRQEQFKKEYAHLKQTMKPEDKIYFVDATHPQHNNMPFYGWIYKGETKTIIERCINRISL
jgi:transposase